MTFLEAAIEVLRHETEPLHFSEIAKRAVERNLLSHVGRDPVAAMQVSLNAAVRGDSALLVRNKPGYYAVRPGAQLPPPPEAPQTTPPPAPPAAAPAVARRAHERHEKPKDVAAKASKVKVNSMLSNDSKDDDEEPAAEAAADEDETPAEEGSGRRKRRRRDRFGVRGEAPPPQQVAIKPTRRGLDTGKRAEVLQKVTPVANLEFEAPRGAGLDGVTDVALVMANAMSRLAEERPELRTEFENMQRGTPAAPAQPSAQQLQIEYKQQQQQQQQQQQGPRKGPPPAAASGRPPADEGEERSGRRKRRRRRRGRRLEWGGGESRAGEEASEKLLQQIAQVLGDAGPRSLHIRQIAETLASQNVLGGEISEIERAVTAALVLDIRRAGRASRFLARGDARYQLQASRLPGGAAAAEQALQAAVRAVDQETTTQLVQWLQALGPRGLEAVARIWLEREGYALAGTLPPSRGVAKLLVYDPESDDDEAKLLVLILPRKAGVDPAAWAGDLERAPATGCLVFAMGELPAEAPWGDARTLTPPELAAWLRSQEIGVSTLKLELTVLDPTIIESISGLDT